MDPLDGGIDLSSNRYVDRARNRAQARRDQIGRGALRACRVDVPDADAHALARQAPTGGEPDAGGAARHDRVLSCQWHKSPLLNDFKRMRSASSQTRLRHALALLQKLLEIAIFLGLESSVQT